MNHRSIWRTGLAGLLAGLVLGGAAASAHAGGVITYGETSLGVNEEGHLNFFGDGPGGGLTYGVFRAGVGDAISPGCLCEGWGVSADTSGGSFSTWASIDNGGIGNISGGSFGVSGNQALSNVQSSVLPMDIRHNFGPSLAADVFQVSVTLTNTSATESLSNVTYRRSMDWDVPPSEFNEYVTHRGVEANLVSNGGNVLYASDNGFAHSSPLNPAGQILGGTVNTDFTDSGPADHGSVFDFSFGTLAPGESRSFNIFYGSAPDEAGALDRLNTLNADVYSLGQSFPNAESGEPATFLFAFGGVGGVAPGATEEVPVLPFVTGPGEFTFVDPTPRLWFDPPFAEGFEYEVIGGEFLEVMVPSAAFGFGPLDVLVGGMIVATLDPGENYLFGPGVTNFSIVGFTLDTAAPGFATAFPTFLDFTPGVTSMSMTAILSVPAVPEPSEWALMLAGLGVVAWSTRRRKPAVPA